MSAGGFVNFQAMAAFLGLAQDWTPTSAPSLNWSCLASSADGGRLFGGDYLHIYTSTNFGNTWTLTSAPTKDWNSVACSADGSVVVAAVQYGFGTGNGLYVSTNFGASWTLGFSPSNHWWNSVACSADGKRMAGASGASWWATNAVYLSTNSGADWFQTSAANGTGQLAMSADGARLAIATSAGVDVSTNSGLSWTATYPERQPISYPISAASSGAGTTLIALTQGPLVWPLGQLCTISMSSDWGATWKPVGNPPNAVTVACSADGVTLAAAASSVFLGSRLFLSTNSGATWSITEIPSLTNLCSLACSPDGSRLVAALGQTMRPDIPSIYVRQTTPVPRLNIVSSPGRLALSWLLPSEPFGLEESSDLLTWSQVNTTPTLNYTNLHYVVNLPAPIVPKFYRLISQ